jgi:hypothetical protein
VSRGSDGPDDFGFDVDFDFPEEDEAGDSAPGQKGSREGSRLSDTLGGLRRRPGVLTPATIRRRRTAAIIGLAAFLIFVAVIIAVLAGGDGGGDDDGGAAEPQSPPAVVTPPETAPPPPVEPATPQPPTFEEGTVLRPGDSGESVTLLQEALAQLGYDVEPDGEYGPATEEAVAAFQRDQELADDGVAGAETIAALEAALGASGT